MSGALGPGRGVAAERTAQDALGPPCESVHVRGPCRSHTTAP
jgi:hypothetical protein